MGRRRKVRPDWAALATIWEVPDELWAVLAPLIAAVDPPKPAGRRRVDARAILNAILFRMRSGCQWNQLPERFPDDSTVHRTFQRWVGLGLFERLWAVLLERCDELGGVDWQWQAADGAMGKARLGGTSSGPTRPTAASAG
jgi:putative transposase